MNFIKLSMSHEYLYSPKSWLHYQKTGTKIIILAAYLVLLPAIPLSYMRWLFLILLLLCKSINIPHELRKYFYAHFAICSLFLLISVQQDNVSQPNKLDDRKMLRFCGFESSNKINALANKRFNDSCFCVPVSAVRFASIYLAYIILIRFLLITTSYVNIINAAIANFRYSNRSLGVKFVFATIVSSNLLKIFFEQIKAARISYILRNADFYYANNSKVILPTYLHFLQEFLTKTSVRIYSISSALYSRNIQCANLDTYKPCID